MQESRAISMKELREWYETRTLKETVEHFELRHPRELYRLLDRANIPRKQPVVPIELVD